MTIVPAARFSTAAIIAGAGGVAATCSGPGASLVATSPGWRSLRYHAPAPMTMSASTMTIASTGVEDFACGGVAGDGGGGTGSAAALGVEAEPMFATVLSDDSIRVASAEGAAGA